MKALFVILSLTFIFGWNAFLAQRDAKMLKSYDQVCAELPQPHPDCRYSN